MTVLSTLGAGKKEPAETPKRISLFARNAAPTVMAPLLRLPTGAVMRSANSFCTITVIDSNPKLLSSSVITRFVEIL